MNPADDFTAWRIQVVLGRAIPTCNKRGRPSMPTNQKQTASAWEVSVEMPRYQSLKQDVRADVCIVGAGIAGMTTAYLLARRGKAVVVVDAEQVGTGQTQRTTA